MGIKNIYFVTSFTHSGPAKLIRFRQAINPFPHPGEQYAHVSFSRDKELANMVSLARTKEENIFSGGFVRENIRKGLFTKFGDSQIAVFEVPLEENKAESVIQTAENYFEHRNEYSFNYPGVFVIGAIGKGISGKKSKTFFCSEFAATILKENDVHILKTKKGTMNKREIFIEPKDTKPYDFYYSLQGNLIYEGLASRYDEFLANETYYEREHKGQEAISESVLQGKKGLLPDNRIISQQQFKRR